MSFRKNISKVLFPLTCWYAVGVRFRNMFYAMGIIKQEAPHITTIGVGNLSTGGTGKTPHVEYLLRLLADQYPTAMLSRGYKRKTKGYVEDDGSHDPAHLGDEPAMIATKFPQVKVAVCEQRLEGVQRLMTQPPIPEKSDDSKSPENPEPPEKNTTPQLIVLDDVFQHRRIKPSINILLTEYNHPYYNDHILPYGDLREFKSARFRANIVIVTKCPPVLNPVERHNIAHDLGLRNYQKIFFSYLVYGQPTTLDGHTTNIDLSRIDNVLAVTGIAHPDTFIAELRQRTRTQHLSFADHHDFTASDLARISSAFDALPGSNKIIITTEKDAMRLHGKTGNLPVYYLPITVAFHKEKDLDFDAIIESTVRENISFLSKLSIWN